MKYLAAELRNVLNLLKHHKLQDRGLSLFIRSKLVKLEKTDAKVPVFTD